MTIHPFNGNKKEYLTLLLLADEQESMIDKYLEKGDMYLLDDQGVKGACVVTKEADGVYEVKNIAVLPGFQRRGYGRQLLAFVMAAYADCHTLLVGTGDCPSSLSFYTACGFVECHRVRNFFTDHYDHPIYEDGVQLVDMVYLQKKR